MHCSLSQTESPEVASEMVARPNSHYDTTFAEGRRAQTCAGTDSGHRWHLSELSNLGKALPASVASAELADTCNQQVECDLILHVHRIPLD